MTACLSQNKIKTWESEIDGDNDDKDVNELTLQKVRRENRVIRERG